MSRARMPSTFFVPLLFISLWILATRPVSSANFQITSTVGSSVKTQSFAKAEQVIDAMKASNLSSNFPSYTGTEAVVIALDFRGLPMNISYASGSNNLVLSIPALGISQTFSGSSRDDSNRQFKDWMKKDGAHTLNAIMKKLAEVSPNDPLAGNPHSLMSQMVANDFSQSARSMAPKGETAGSTNNLIGIGVSAQSLEDNGRKSKNFTIPFSYIALLDFNPRHQLTFFIPISYVEVEDAKSYNVSFGMGYRFPVMDQWTLTPALGTGVVGSIDLGSAGQIISGSLTSHYEFQLPAQMTLSLANMIGNYQTMKLKVSDYESDPDLNNTVFRNGLLLSFPHMLFSYQMESEFFFLDTRFTGSKLYMDAYNELGLSLGTNKSVTDLTKFLRFGISYLFSSKAKGFGANFGYSF